MMSDKVKCKLDLLPIDAPTINGRIYPKSLIENALNMFFEKAKDMIVVKNLDYPFDPGSIDFTSAVALVEKEDLELTNDSLTLISYTPLNLTDENFDITKLIEQKIISIAPFGVGNIDDDDLVSEYRILGLQLDFQNEENK